MTSQWRSPQESATAPRVFISGHLYTLHSVMAIDARYSIMLERFPVSRSLLQGYFLMVININNNKIELLEKKKIINYLNYSGHTDDYHVMLSSLLDKHPSTKIVCVGFSLGGNLVTKYMGERAMTKSPQIIGGISICQGYNAIE